MNRDITMKYPQQMFIELSSSVFFYSIRIQSQGAPIRVHLFEFYSVLVATNGWGKDGIQKPVGPGCIPKNHCELSLVMWGYINFRKVCSFNWWRMCFFCGMQHITAIWISNHKHQDFHVHKQFKFVQDNLWGWLLGCIATLFWGGYHVDISHLLAMETCLVGYIMYIYIYRGLNLGRYPQNMYKKDAF